MDKLRKLMSLFLMICLVFIMEQSPRASLKLPFMEWQQNTSVNPIVYQGHTVKNYKGFVKTLESRAEKLESDSSRTMMISHRGYNLVAPENTMAAFKRAAKAGFHVIETDIRMTQDGVPVCIHDQAVDRMTDGEGLVSLLTLEEIESFTISHGNGLLTYDQEHIPTLREFLLFCKESCIRPILDMKVHGKKDILTVCQLVMELDLSGQVIFQDNNSKALKGIRQRIPDAELWFLSRYLTPIDISRAKALNCSVINANHLSGLGIKMAHKESVTVCCWNRDDKVGRERYTGYGIDYMMTDRY